MLQAFITYAIVIIAACWLGWKLFLPASLKRKLLPAGKTLPDCSSGCAACRGCPPE